MHAMDSCSSGRHRGQSGGHQACGMSQSWWKCGQDETSQANQQCRQQTLKLTPVAQSRGSVHQHAPIRSLWACIIRSWPCTRAKQPSSTRTARTDMGNADLGIVRRGKAMHDRPVTGIQHLCAAMPAESRLGARTNMPKWQERRVFSAAAAACRVGASTVCCR